MLAAERGPSCKVAHEAHGRFTDTACAIVFAPGSAIDTVHHTVVLPVGPAGFAAKCPAAGDAAP